MCKLWKGGSILVKLERLIEDFDRGLHNFYTNDRASFSMFRKGPCLHFHIRTVKKLRDLLHQYNSYAQVCSHPEYAELLYATLTAWGMNLVGGRIHSNRLEADEVGLQDFEKFQENLNDHKLINSLEHLRDERLRAPLKLTSLNQSRLGEIKEEVKHAYEYLAQKRVVKSKRAIVAVSKVLHHLVPDLLMPVDGEHILKFLNKLEDKDENSQPLRPSSSYNYDTFDAYWSCVKISRHIAEKRGIVDPSKWEPRDPKFSIKKRPMDTSTPKMIDNAIIGLSGPKEVSTSAEKVYG